MYQDFTLLELSFFPFMGCLRTLLLFVSQDPEAFATLVSLGFQFTRWVSGLAFNEEELPVVDVLLPVRVQQVPVEATSLWQRLEIHSGLWSRRLSSLQGLPGYLPRLPSDQVRARILGGPVVPRYLRRVPVQPVRLWWKFLSQSSRSSITFVSSSVFVLLVTL